MPLKVKKVRGKYITVYKVTGRVSKPVSIRIVSDTVRKAPVVTVASKDGLVVYF